MKEQIKFDEFHRKNYERIQKLRLIDDEFAEVVFNDNETTEFLLKGIFNRDDIKVRDVTCQYDIKNLNGRSIRLDVFAVDETNTVYDVEIQRSDTGAVEKRARYNSSLIDAHLAKRGDDYKSLNTSFVIFITENDVLGYGLPVYTIKRYVEEIMVPFNDGSSIIYVNSKCQNVNTTLGKIMHDFYQVDPDMMYCSTLARRVNYFKKNEKGVKFMSRIIEEMQNEAILRRNREVALKMLESGKLTIEEISNFSGLTLEQVEALENEFYNTDNTLTSNLGGMHSF